MNFIWYILIGLVAGSVAGKLTQGKGFGFWVDLVVGIIGGVLGGWLFGLMGIWVESGSIVGNLVSSTVGAIVLLAVVSLFRKR
ncbi:MAG: GlsB/YeaQ/YmgE family stress response membrane protein [Rikenellaceae bacterium]|jgi:uncharacterized membrane protein YeaQ/YmgE (transglycosylase-associated protein family)|nr:GlsB/YeaQ/YmgE family stress response membrane protein [Rikenellaceae bacterium]